MSAMTFARRRTLVAAVLTVAATCAPSPNPAGGGGAEGDGHDGAAPGGAAHTGAAPAEAAAAHTHDHRAMAATDAGERSLHLLPARWADQHGDSLTLADLGGRVNVVAMVYTHCTFACPRILARMKAIEARVEEDPRVGFVLVSIDPERDTAARLAEFARSTRLDPARWTLLSGSADDVLTLSVLLGVKYQATGEGGFAHSNVLTVLDAAGVPVHRVEGLGADLDRAFAAVREALPAAKVAVGAPSGSGDVPAAGARAGDLPAARRAQPAHRGHARAAEPRGGSRPSAVARPR